MQREYSTLVPVPIFETRIIWVPILKTGVGIGTNAEIVLLLIPIPDTGAVSVHPKYK